MAKYKIGDIVWRAKLESFRKSLVCPDCFGKRYLTVILGDDSRVTIDCAGCASGFEPPRGYVEIYQYTPTVEMEKITGVESKMEDGKEVTTYSFGCYCSVSEDSLFTSETEANERALDLAREHSEYEQRKFDRKEKDARTWAWNATYHRGCIKRCEHDLEYHRKKLSAALTHVKAEKRTA